MRAAVQIATRAHRDLLLAADVFDGPARYAWLDAFRADARHHMVIATNHGHCVGFLRPVDMLHPNKLSSLWINELGVNEADRRKCRATRLVGALVAHARVRGVPRGMGDCRRDRRGARGLHQSLLVADRHEPCPVRPRTDFP
jgi:GNAT superfamily N-acetyltransferase